MYKVSTLTFLTRMMELSGSSWKTETARAISDRGDLCRKLASPLFCRWVTKQDSASVRTSGQWGPLREGPVEGQGVRELLPELVLKTERERGQNSLAYPSSCPLPRFFCH